MITEPVGTIERREDALFEGWMRDRPEVAPTFWKDGVADEAKFLAARIPTLLLLKEPNATSDDQHGWDMRVGIRRGIEHAQTWNNVARWAQGIAALPDSLAYADVAEQTTMSRTHHVSGLAVVNVKKIPGGPVAGDRAIHAFAREHAGYLRAQLALYNPRITICCGSAWYLPDLYTQGELGEWRRASTGVQWRQSSVIGAIIRYKHPQSRRVTARRLYEDLVNTVREILN